LVDPLNRLKRDRELFMVGSRQQLLNIVSNGNPRLVAGAITGALEIQIATEEVARERGVEIDEDALAEYAERNRENLDKEVDRAVNAFIMSVVSQEG